MFASLLETKKETEKKTLFINANQIDASWKTKKKRTKEHKKKRKKKNKNKTKTEKGFYFIFGKCSKKYSIIKGNYSGGTV